MQGIESLDNFKSFVSSLGGLGRFEDTYIVHAAEGETVVPMEVLDRNPLLKKRLFQSMVDMGIEPGRYIVGHELNSKNPVTGQPEFFLKKIVSQIRKALPGDTEQFLGPLVGLATGNPLFGAIAGGIGAGVPGAIYGGASGFASPGAKELFGIPIPGSGDAKATGIMELLTGGDDFAGIFGKGGKFKFGEGTLADAHGFQSQEDKLSAINEATRIAKEQGFDLNTPGGAKAFEKIYDDLLKENIFVKLARQGFGIKAIGDLLKSADDDQDVGVSQYTFKPSGEEFEGGVFDPLNGMKEGGITDLRQGGMSLGPGTETSDDIPAMLSDGEFVMTAKAVRGAGGGDRREGAKKMYEAMDRLEAQA